jgi:hypothetical protein
LNYYSAAAWLTSIPTENICSPTEWAKIRPETHIHVALAYTRLMPPFIRIIFQVLILILPVAGSPLDQSPHPEWTEPFPPFHIAGNLYYVGSKGLANYLITTPKGNILINSDLEANVPMIRASIEKLGFKF